MTSSPQVAEGLTRCSFVGACVSWSRDVASLRLALEARGSSLRLRVEAPEEGRDGGVLEVPQPWASYWLTLDRRLEGWESLPEAFRWLLRLCAGVCQTSVDDLMGHVRALERTALM